jgi:ferredoxin
MERLPIDKRGYPVPWFVDWINGEPEFRAMDMQKFRRAVNDRRCWTCGKQLYAEEVFVIGPMCAVNRISSEPPSHRECAEYAAKNCPFLSKPQMHRRSDETIDAMKQKGAGVMIERNPGVSLLWYTRRHMLLTVRNRPGAGDGLLFQLGRPFKTEWYCRGRPATRAEVLESMESGIPLLRAQAEKHDGPAATAHLEHQITQAYRLLPQ